MIRIIIKEITCEFDKHEEIDELILQESVNGFKCYENYRYSVILKFELNGIK